MVASVEVISYSKFYPDIFKMLPVATLFFVGPIFFMLWGFIRLVFNKMAYKVIINKQNDELKLWVFFMKRPLSFSLSELQSVIMILAIHYVFQDGRQYKGMNTEKEIIDFLRKNNVNIEWVGYGKLRKKHYE